MNPQPTHFMLKAVEPTADGSVVVLGLNPRFHSDARMHPDVCVLISDEMLERALNGLSERPAMKLATVFQSLAPHKP